MGGEMKIRLLAVMAGTVLNCGAVLSQTPPTATEAFNLRIRCQAMADEKAESLEWHPMNPTDGASVGLSPTAVDAMNRRIEATQELISAHHSSHYDANNNRCYIEIFQHKKFGQHKENERQMRKTYDAQTDDLLAFAQIENGKKVGMVFDPQYQSVIGETLGWDDANSYIDEMMLDKRK